MIKDITIKGTFEKRISQKSGKEYECLVLHLAPNYDKVVFLDKAEKVLLENQSK